MRRAATALACWIGLAAMGCGGATAPSDTTAEAREDAAPRPLDWSRLLPVETEGIVRIDLARIRRSPHHEALAPHLAGLLEGLGDADTVAAASELLDRTDAILLAMLPTQMNGREEMLVLASGRYREDEVARLEAASPDATAPTEVRGYRVWVDAQGGDRTVSAAQVRPDTVVLASSPERMARLLARADAPPSGPAWPSRVRGLVEEAGLDGATVAFVMGEGGERRPLAMTGRADMDAALEVEVRMHLPTDEDPNAARFTVMVLEAMLQGIAEGASQEVPILGELPRLTRIEALPDGVVGRLHADLATARDLVPALVGLILANDDAPREEVGPPGGFGPGPMGI